MKIPKLTKCVSCGVYPRFHVNYNEKTVYMRCPECGTRTLATYNFDLGRTKYLSAMHGWNDKMSDVLDKTRSE
jgi:predicted RNA-binding Zn-ribbon protein involved in translation (DUF1610 family)